MTIVIASRSWFQNPYPSIRRPRFRSLPTGVASRFCGSHRSSSAWDTGIATPTTQPRLARARR
eukprot:11168132-Heterocapsa_arctica.AAC.1